MVRSVRFALVALALLALEACSGRYALPNGATSQALVMHQDWTIFFYAGLAVAVIVGALILIPLVAWRRRDDTYPPQFRRNYRWEFVYTGIPVVMVIALFALTYVDEGIVQHVRMHPANRVHVSAFRWSWEFQYPSHGIDIIGTPNQPPQLVLPINETTQIYLTSRDVNHDFWIPAFLFKRDAIAGVNNYFDLRPIRLGVFSGECAVFCGLDHAHMTFTVRVVSQEEYARWLRSGGSPTALSASGTAS